MKFATRMERSAKSPLSLPRQQQRERKKVKSSLYCKVTLVSLSLVLCVCVCVCGCLNVQVREVDLCRYGKKKTVTDANKHEYIELLLHYRFIARVQLKLNAFLNGFWSLVPQSAISKLTPSDLETLLCGERGFNFEDWKSATRYLGKLTSFSRQAYIYFFLCVRVCIKSFFFWQ